MNRAILITGANGQLGLAIARAFLEDPRCRIHLGVRARRDAAAALESDHSGRVALVELDVTSADSWTSALAATGPLSVLVNNAGGHSDALLGTMNDDQWHEVIASNLTGTFLGCRAALRGMLANRQGRIVNISSVSALAAPAGQTNYAAAKAGVIALTRSLAREVARAGITVNAICPGYLASGEPGGADPDTQRALEARIPMRRLGRPEEVAAAVKFLAGDDAGYITGAVLKVDGGIY